MRFQKRLRNGAALLLVISSVTACGGGNTSTPALTAPLSQSVARASTAQATATPAGTAAPGAIVQSTGMPNFPTTPNGSTMTADSDGLFSQTGSSGNVVNFYTSSGTFVRQLDFSGTASSGLPVYRDAEANGSVTTLQLPDFSAVSSGSYTSGDLAYTVDTGSGTTTMQLDGGTPITVTIDPTLSTGSIAVGNGSAQTFSTASTQTTAAIRRSAQKIDPCTASRIALALAIAAAALLAAAAAITCYWVPPSCWAALRAAAAAVAAVIVAFIANQKACATPTPTPPPTSSPVSPPTELASSTPEPADSATPVSIQPVQADSFARPLISHHLAFR